MSSDTYPDPFADPDSWSERLLAELDSYFVSRVWLSLRTHGQRTQRLGGNVISVDLVRTLVLRGWVVRVRKGEAEGLHLSQSGRDALDGAA